MILSDDGTLGVPNSSIPAAGTRLLSAADQEQSWSARVLRQRRVLPQATRREIMNNIIWLVGAVVIVIAILSFFGLR
ncbi:hypothetical protein EB233_24615 [Mesorhizobium erdmanii]|uniref:Uncharacterized protein n=1 Tax=Mesorhizobium erdmanii TaxID=1777866 RepID=A0A6M7UMJ6_9HYPH|nr:hypothetical protein EB233_24615 [Mesorhizobium erdmanii]